MRLQQSSTRIRSGRKFGAYLVITGGIDAALRGRPGRFHHFRGKNFQKMAAAVRPRALAVNRPDARPAAPATVETSNGPPQDPVSVMKRHKPKNCGLAWDGEASAPMVMTSPEPIPLPKPSSNVTSRKDRKPVVNGIKPRAIDMITMHGTATQRRP